MIEEKKKAYKKWFHSGNTEDTIEYKRLSPIIKREIKERKNFHGRNL
jgi:hypothetical protein